MVAKEARKVPAKGYLPFSFSRDVPSSSCCMHAHLCCWRGRLIATRRKPTAKHRARFCSLSVAPCGPWLPAAAWHCTPVPGGLLLLALHGSRGLWHGTWYALCVTRKVALHGGRSLLHGMTPAANKPAGVLREPLAHVHGCLCVRRTAGVQGAGRRGHLCSGCSATSARRRARRGPNSPSAARPLLGTFWQRTPWTPLSLRAWTMRLRGACACMA